MRVAIVGGSLQGIEAAYLCSKAGYSAIVIDRKTHAAAKTLADEFHEIDIVEDTMRARRVLSTVDAVLPANENRTTLVCLERLCSELGIPFMQDDAAFWITSDKLTMSEFLRSVEIPTPGDWPGCDFPVIVKPTRGSGSRNVCRANNVDKLEKALERLRSLQEGLIVQEFIDGPALSLEVISRRGTGQPLQITGLEFDQQYGCKRVYAPVETSNEVEDNLGEIGSKVASGLKLNGLTDVQALLRNSNPRVNEINARLPSQTPSVVCHSANVNMVELLVKLFVEDKLEQVKVTTSSAVVLQHVIVCGNTLIVQGEHVMTDARDLRVERSFLGADEAITNIRTCRGSTRSVATLIAKAPDLRAARKKMNGVVRNIMSEFGLKRFSDPSPTKGGFAV